MLFDLRLSLTLATLSVSWSQSQWNTEEGAGNKKGTTVSVAKVFLGGTEDLCIPTRGYEHSLIMVKPGFQARKYFMVTQHTRVTLVLLGVGLNIGQVARRSDYFYNG